MMKRREFVTLLGGAALAPLSLWPLAARAQQRAMRVLGFLSSASPDTFPDRMRAYFEGMKDAGFEAGRNVTVEYRWARGQYDRLPALAAELVGLKVDVLAAIGGPPQALAAKAATATIPTVFQVGADPIELGLVASLARPGGNITGVSSLNTDVVAKRLELMHELLPAAATIALLINPTNPAGTEILMREAQAAARTLGVQVQVLRASTESELEAALAALVQQRAGGLVIALDAFFTSRNQQIAAFALRHALPTISAYREFAVVGGLMSYGGDITDSWRLAGVYTGRVLRGDKPSDLPVQQSTKVELVVNLKTARAIGLAVPLPLIGRADEVIE